MTRRPNLAQAELDRIVVMREKGYGHALIAAEIGCSIGSVQWHCLRLCTDPPKQKETRPDVRPMVMYRRNRVVRRFSPEDDEKIIAMRSEGATLAEICSAVGRRHNSIAGRLMTLARREERREKGL